MIKDRGSIKWQGMMLPEHVAKINYWRNKRYEERPQLDDFDLQSIQEEIESAYTRKQKLSNYFKIRYIKSPPFFSYARNP